MIAGTERGEFTVPVFLCKRMTETPLFYLPHNAGFPFFFLYLHHQNNRQENISIFLFAPFNPVGKNLF